MRSITSYSFQLILTVLMLTILMTAPLTPLSALGGQEESPADTSSNESTSGPQEDAPFLRITDDLGRDVVLNTVPTRVLGLARQFMEELFELGVTPVGRVDEYSNRPEGLALPSVGSQSAPNIERILELQPDLILVNTRQHSDMTDVLESMGATVFFVDPTIEDGDFFKRRVRLFGRLLDRTNEAESYVANLDKTYAEVRQQVSRCDFETGILLQGGSDAVRAAQPTGLYGALFPALGIENVVPLGLPGAGASTFVPYDLETITQEDPDVILVRAAGSGERNPERLLQFYRESAQWQGVSAVRENRIVVLPPRINPGAISSQDALRTTADILCPAP